jgi:hypothetical protein
LDCVLGLRSYHVQISVRTMYSTNMDFDLSCLPTWAGQGGVDTVGVSLVW